MKKWDVLKKFQISNFKFQIEELLDIVLQNRGIKLLKEKKAFVSPPNPHIFTPRDVEIDSQQVKDALKRIQNAINKKESVVVYADYDADGITAGAIMWETLHSLGATVMPYIPHRVEEGYGLSVKGIDAVRELFDPSLIITVDHGITAWEKVEYAKKLGIDIIVTDHHVKPKKLPRCTIIHTTKLSGAGVSWFLAKELANHSTFNIQHSTLVDHVALAAIGTIADMMPLTGPNRSIVKHGITAINVTTRVGLDALIGDAGLTKGALDVYSVSHALAPRLNAMGRLEHAMDALRLICTKQEVKARLLAEKLGLTNRQRQQLTEETVLHARELLPKSPKPLRKLIFVSHESYNQGVIGLVAGKLVEEYYRPAIVVAKGELVSKASARSIAGFNIVEAIRSCSDILVDVGGHPMAAGFTVETKHLKMLQRRLEELAEKELDDEALTRTLRIDAEIPLDIVSEELWQKLRDFEPFGFGNPEPVFATRKVIVKDARLVGTDGKHLKLRLALSNQPNLPRRQAGLPNVTNVLEAIAFNFGNLYGQLRPNVSIDIAYTIAVDTWNGTKRLQLKVKDIHI